MKKINKKSKSNYLKQDINKYAEFLLKQPKGFIYNDPEIKIETKHEKLQKLYSEHKNCQNCPLKDMGRTKIVFGEGDSNTKLMFVGEGPGKDENLQGKPFVGRAGQLLTKIINSMNLKREDIYLSNVVKCRPPNNRTPLPSESETCKNLLLLKEINIIQPKIICTLGSCATKALLGNDIQISKARGNFFIFQEKYLVMPTFHPAYLLRNPNSKKEVWQDMKSIIEKLLI
ncbi:uracil-DNA glycosylase [Candidatus Babeliales bacterium]|nr:uracil-DNA glycosylase [Candidatus Babeliales bacterium]